MYCRIVHQHFHRDFRKYRFVKFPFILSSLGVPIKCVVCYLMVKHLYCYPYSLPCRSLCAHRSQWLNVVQSTTRLCNVCIQTQKLQERDWNIDYWCSYCFIFLSLFSQIFLGLYYLFPTWLRTSVKWWWTIIWLRLAGHWEMPQKKSVWVPKTYSLSWMLSGMVILIFHCT